MPRGAGWTAALSRVRYYTFILALDKGSHEVAELARLEGFERMRPFSLPFESRGSAEVSGSGV